MKERERKEKEKGERQQATEALAFAVSFSHSLFHIYKHTHTHTHTHACFKFAHSTFFQSRLQGPLFSLRRGDLPPCPFFSKLGPSCRCCIAGFFNVTHLYTHQVQRLHSPRMCPRCLFKRAHSPPTLLSTRLTH